MKTSLSHVAVAVLTLVASLSCAQASGGADVLVNGHTMMAWIACTNMHSEACAPPRGPCLRSADCAKIACRKFQPGSCLSNPGFHLCTGIQCLSLMRQRASTLGRLSTGLAQSKNSWQAQYAS